MELIKEIFLQNAFASAKAAVVIILLFILTKPITKRYTAGFRYYSWLAVMLVFLIPFTAMGISYTVDFSALNNTVNTQAVREWYSENAPEYSITEEYVGRKRVESENEDEEAQYVPVTKTAEMKTPVDIAAILALLWLIGAIGYFAVHIGRYISFKRGLRRLYRDIDDERIYAVLEQEKQRLGISKNIRLKLFSATDTPLLTGLFRPEIILPHTAYTDDEMHLILRHELFHLKRNDILYQFITLIFVSLHWFNPFVYLMARAVEIDGETSCDEKTLTGKAYEERIFYGEMLLKFLKTSTQKRSYMTTTFFGGKKGMKKRLNLIKSKTARKKGTAAMAVVMIITIALSVSAAAMGNDYFSSVFEGDTSYLADFIKTEKRSVEDDRFKLTLEQYLVAENQAMIIYSFEAKTDDAVEELNSGSFYGMDTIVLAPTDLAKARLSGHGGHGTVGKGLNTERKIYGCIASDTIKNEEKIDFYLTTDKIKGSPKILIPMDYNMETKTVECGNVTVKYNPISIIATAPYSEIISDCEYCHDGKILLFLRMKNGEIKTLNQLYDHSSGGTMEVDENGNPSFYESRAWARKIIEPDEIKSIIVNDTEYPVDNPSNAKPITIDEHWKPFFINAYVQNKNEHLWIPLRELCNGLGIAIKWDNDTKTASFDYRGSSYALTVGETGMVMDGVKYEFGDEAPFIDGQGRMIVPPLFTLGHENCYIAIDAHLYNAFVYDEATGESTMVPNPKWHIIP